jgi:hypothetical protein
MARQRRRQHRDLACQNLGSNVFTETGKVGVGGELAARL